MVRVARAPDPAGIDPGMGLSNRGEHEVVRSFNRHVCIWGRPSRRIFEDEILTTTGFVFRPGKRVGIRVGVTDLTYQGDWVPFQGGCV